MADKKKKKQIYKDSLSRPGRGVGGLSTRVGGLGKESNLSYNAVKGTKFGEIDVDMSSMPKSLRKILSYNPLSFLNPYKDSSNKKTTKKAKGGVVRAYSNGGAVMSGRGPKFKGTT